MTDPHLNLFYTYNRDSELIENNLTRAWIVTLKMLSGEVRQKLLKSIFTSPLENLGQRVPDFTGVDYALQGNIDPRILAGISNKYVVTLATNREMDDGPADLESLELGDSIPDGWVFDKDEGYCFLFEVKVGTYPLGSSQVYSHAKNWLRIPKIRVQDHLIMLTWHDVLKAMKGIPQEIQTDQDSQILSEFREYLRLFGYRLFSGFDLGNLRPAPGFALSG